MSVITVYLVVIEITTDRSVSVGGRYSGNMEYGDTPMSQSASCCHCPGPRVSHSWQASWDRFLRRRQVGRIIIATALRAQSDSLRVRRRQRAEQPAHNTGVKLVFPLVLCIFPGLLVVLLAPAMLSVIEALSGISN